MFHTHGLVQRTYMALARGTRIALVLSIMALAALVVLGVILRFYALESIPPGLDNDEGIYAFNVLRYLTAGQLRLFVDYGFKWETAIGYVYALCATFFGSSVLLVRILSSLFSILLIVMFYMIGKSLWNSTVALLSAALASISFLLVFYGRLGWCASHILLVDCVAFYFLLRYFREEKYRWLLFCAIFSVIGLMTYATFRVMLIYFFFVCCVCGQGLKRKVSGISGAVIAPVIAYITAVFFIENSLMPVLERGMHNVSLSDFSAAENYIYSLMLFFHKPPEHFRLISNKFYGDGVHKFLYDSFLSPEGFVLSMVILFSMGVAIVLCWSRLCRGEYSDPVILLSCWALIYFVVVGYVGPSYTRLLGILVPLLLISAYVLYRGIVFASRRPVWQGVLVTVGIIAVLVLSMSETWGRLRQLGKNNSKALRTFNWNAVQMIENAKKRSAPEERVLVFSFWGREAIQYLSFDIPFHDSFTDSSWVNFQRYEREGRDERVFILQEGPSSENLIRAIEMTYQGVRAKKFHILETNVDYVELCVPSGARRLTRPEEAKKVEKILAVNMIEGGMGTWGAQFNEPRGIAMDAQGNIYIADFRNSRIQKFDRTGKFVAAWGEKGECPGQFKDPCGVAVDARGQVYVADTFNNRIQVFDGNGKYILHFERGFFAPRDIAVDGSGRIWVADSGNGVVKLFSAKGEQLKLIGKRGQGKGEFDGPNSVAIDQKGKVYVADTGNRRVQVLDGEGNYLSQFAVDGWQHGFYNEPYLDIDERGDIYLTDPPGNRILKYSQKGKLLGALKPMEGAEPLLSFPMGIAVGKDTDAVFVVDCRNHKIRKFSKIDFKLV